MTVSSSEPTFRSALIVDVKFVGQLDAVALDGREARQREGDRVHARPQVDDLVLPRAVGHHTAGLLDQHIAGRLDRHARQHRARRVFHQPRNRALCVRDGGHQRQTCQRGNHHSHKSTRHPSLLTLFHRFTSQQLRFHKNRCQLVRNRMRLTSYLISVNRQITIKSVQSDFGSNGSICPYISRKGEHTEGRLTTSGLTTVRSGLTTVRSSRPPAVSNNWIFRWANDLFMLSDRWRNEARTRTPIFCIVVSLLGAERSRNANWSDHWGTVAILALTLVPATAHAQSTLTGVVKDASGAVLARRDRRSRKPGPHRENPIRRHRRDRRLSHRRICGPAPTRSRSRSKASRPSSVKDSNCRPTSR